MLSALQGDAPFVLAIPRGGVIIADTIARCWRAPLDVVVARKIVATPREIPIGAIAAGGTPVFDEQAIASLGLDAAALDRLVDAPRANVARALLAIRGAWPIEPLGGRTVLLVDDGIVTGLTVLAAVAAIRARHAGRVVVAAPVCSAEAAERLAHEAIDVVRLRTLPAPLAAAAHAADELEPCPPLGDEEIHALVEAERGDVGARPLA